ncbi:hypothetical protein PG984_014303 [Apiospora sp. TS-2023a]
MSLTTSTFTRDGTAFPLPPQTTPFTYQASDSACASPSIYCPWIIGQDTSPFGGQVCTLGFSTSNSDGPAFNSQKEQCYPPSFFTVFRDDPNADPVYPDDQDIITLAYPGTACPQNWATACTTDITVAASDDADGKVTKSRQAWCCASGYQCTSASDSFSWLSSTKPFERQCFSYLNSQTEIWASWDPPATPSGPPTDPNSGGEYYTWPTSITWQPPKDKWTVYHKPLPLAVSSWSGKEKKGEEGEPAAPRATRAEVVKKEAVVAEPAK